MPTFRRALIAIFLAVSLIPNVILAVFIYASVRKDAEAGARERNEALAAASTLFVTKSVDDAEQRLERSLAAVGDASPRRASVALEGLLIRDGPFESAQVLDSAGRLVMKIPWSDEEIGTDMSGQDYFRAAYRGSGPVYGNSFLSAATGNPTVPMAIREGQAIVVGFLSLDWLGDLADAGSFGRSGRITIADAAGTLIADKERAGVRERVNVSGVSIFSSVPDQRRGSSEFDWSGERRLGSIGYDARRGWRIVVSESIADAYAVTRRVAVESLFGCVLAVLATWGAAWLTGRNLIGSFAALDREAGEVAAGNYREIRVRPYFSEIQAYVRSFNAMTSAVRAREESLARARDEIGAALAEKGVLLREVHHRVKNNLQVISSLLGLQEGSAEGQSAASALRASRLRVQSMALVHEKLYASGDADRIDMAAYLEELAAELRCQYLRPAVVVTVIGEPLELDLVSAIPCGLFAFEALSNSFRHGFPSDRKGSIDIRLSSRSGEARIDISDDGEGMGEASRSGEGLGGQLMASLASQLSGSVTRRVEGAGTRVSLTFPLGPGRGSAAPGAQADEE